MDAQQAWQSVLEQIQMEMPRASFDTWVRDTEALSLDDGTLTITTRNTYARDWLESRLQNKVQRLLVGILNQPVDVCFVVRIAAGEEPDAIQPEDEPDVAVEPVQWLDYDRIVQPHKQIVVKGYLRRLGIEIGPKAIWLYVGFHQAAWKANRPGCQPLYSGDVVRFSGLSSSAFWRLMKQEKIHEQLTGLVQRIDPLDERRYHRGRDRRPHRSPVRYQVCMTPRLTQADAKAVFCILRQCLALGLSLSNGLEILIGRETILETLSGETDVQDIAPYDTVMDIVRELAGEEHTPDLDRLAQELHRKIINSLCDIHIPHYFITHTIHHYNLTPAQAWLITIARDMAYINARTGERREVVTFKNGYQEMAELVGSSRYKTIQSWFNPQWQTKSWGGDIRRFLQQLPVPNARSYADLRTENMPRSIRVLLDEPLDVIVDADGGNMVDANGSALTL
ncbi:MAG: DnaA N-terminal domain-containing protein [Anaerolineales bacterium]